jgi:hypothetical protein
VKIEHLVGFVLGIFSAEVVKYFMRRASRIRSLTVSAFERIPGTSDGLITLSDRSVLRGSGTVWHWCPSGKRASTRIERICSEEWTRQAWREVP